MAVKRMTRLSDRQPVAAAAMCVLVVDEARSLLLQPVSPVSVVSLAQRAWQPLGQVIPQTPAVEVPVRDPPDGNPVNGCEVLQQDALRRLQ